MAIFSLPEPGDERKPPLHLRVRTHPVNNIVVGTTLRLYAQVTTGDKPIAPESLKFEVTDSQGQLVEYLDIQCDELGTYFVRIPLLQSGPYDGRVTIGGEDAQVQTLSFVVSD